jgi:hypothetical protein
LHQLTRIPRSKTVQQHPVGDAEYRRADAHAKGEKQQRHGGEGGTFQKHTQAVTKILQGGFDRRKTARIAAFLFHLAESAELKPRHSLGLFGSETGASSFFNVAFEVKTKLIFEFGFRLISLE